MKNPLLDAFELPYEAIPFSKIETIHFKPAFLEAIKIAKDEVNQIAESSEEPNFKNTLVALEYSGEKLSRISSAFFNLNSAETNDEIQKIAQEVSPLLSEFANDVRLNAKLFKRIQIVFENKGKFELDSEDLMLLEKNYKSFVRNGAHLSEDEKLKLREIDTKLSQLSLKFGENVLAETNEFSLLIEDENDLDGLPDTAKEAAKMLAEERGESGWVITLDYPSYIPFMTYASNRKLRKELALAFGSRAANENQYNNEENVLQIVNLRHQRAQLLGYDSHAQYVLEERMAESPEKVDSFLHNLLSKAKPAATGEFENLVNLAKKDGVDQLQKWDSAYYSEKLKKSLFDLDDEKLKPYFQLSNVIDGVFKIAGKLYGLQFEQIDYVDKYHEEVLTYKVMDDTGGFISLFYADFFPRKGKRNGAWMTSYKSQWKKGGENSRPHVSIVCNFTKPTKTKPSLLTFNEVTTLFHEFGHALHGMLANTKYPNLSGTSVYWDFVELPSQIFENWCYEKEALDLFAFHYETKEVIPFELVEKIKSSANFLEGIATMRQLSFGMLDMAYHSQDPSKISDIKSFEKDVFKETQLFPVIEGQSMSAAFSHIFQGGYSSGYYSYKWAEVLDADAFEAFKEEGIFDKNVATRFKDHILSQGGTEKPMSLYKKFRGKEPSPEALLKRSGTTVMPLCWSFLLKL